MQGRLGGVHRQWLSAYHFWHKCELLELCFFFYLRLSNATVLLTLKEQGLRGGERGDFIPILASLALGIHPISHQFDNTVFSKCLFFQDNLGGAEDSGWGDTSPGCLFCHGQREWHVESRHGGALLIYVKNLSCESSCMDAGKLKKTKSWCVHSECTTVNLLHVITCQYIFFMF